MGTVFMDVLLTSIMANSILCFISVEMLVIQCGVHDVFRNPCGDVKVLHQTDWPLTSAQEFWNISGTPDSSTNVQE
jgi:hypothetical protein